MPLTKAPLLPILVALDELSFMARDTLAEYYELDRYRPDNDAASNS